MKSASRAKTDSVWFVTGATSGFGRALSSAVLAQGARLVATGREIEALHELVRPHADRAMAVPLDVTDAAAAHTAARLATERFGRVDVVFNNAGYGHVGAAEELSDTELRRQIDVNLFGNINVARALLPYLRQQRSGHIVQMSSLNGVEGIVGGAYYAASKFGIEGFSESLADEIAPFGIKVTIVEPGPFRTRFLGDVSAKWAEPMPDYAATVGKAREQLHGLNGRQPGDPERAARAIMRVVGMEHPPRRLPLGRMALEHIRKTLRAELDELERCTEIAVAADYPSEEQGKGMAASDGVFSSRAREELVERAYSAFNRRSIDEALDLLSPDVDWPKVPDGGFVHGREQVGRHWREQFAAADPRIEVDDLAETQPDRVEAHVRQIVRDRAGRTVSDDRLLHVFTIGDDGIRRLDVQRASG